MRTCIEYNPHDGTPRVPLCGRASWDELTTLTYRSDCWECLSILGIDIDDRYDQPPPEVYECPEHRDVTVTAYDEAPSMAGYGTDGATSLSCGGIIYDGPYSSGKVVHPTSAPSPQNAGVDGVQ